MEGWDGDALKRVPCINMLCSFVCVNKLVYVSKYMQLIPYEPVDYLLSIYHLQDQR